MMKNAVFRKNCGKLRKTTETSNLWQLYRKEVNYCWIQIIAQ